MKWTAFLFFGLLLQMGTFATASAQEKWPYIETEKTSDGKYGIPDGKGGWKVEPLFDFILFGGGEELGIANYNDRYFIIDRDFKVVSDGSCEQLPWVASCYALVRGEGQCYAINYRGERISDVYEELEPFDDTSHNWLERESLLLAKRKGASKYFLLGMDFRSICDFDLDRGDPRSYVINAVDNCKGENERKGALILFLKDGKNGLMNLKGEILIPAVYDEIDYLLPENYVYKDYKLHRVCTKDEYERFLLFLGKTNDGMVTGFDMTGKQIFPKQKSGSVSKILSRNQKKYINPYLANMAEHDKDYKERVFYPYQEFMSRMEGYVAELKTETKHSDYDLLALARREKAKEKRRQQMIAIKERTQARRAAKARQIAALATGRRSNANQGNQGSTSRKGQRDINGRIISSEVELPYMGGTMHITMYEDGYSLNVTRTPCFMCAGSGQCKACFGRGQYYHAALKTWQPCLACFGTTRCKYCNGQGRTVIQRLWASGEAEAYLAAMKASESGSSSSNYESSSSSSSSSSSRSTRHNDGIEVIEYAPNYTGQPNDVWCERCQEVMPRHSHIWKR